MIGARTTVVCLCVVVLGLGVSAFAEIERFKPKEGDAIEVWRITNDPTVRDHANYHNMQCWSPDGRYLCFTHYASNGRQFGSTSAAEVHLYDLHAEQDIKIDKGTNPRWANKHNWLFYLQYGPDGGPRHGKGTQIMWNNVETGQTTRIGYGIERLKITDSPIRPGESLELPGRGTYRAVAIEWSGLQSGPSLPLRIRRRAAMKVLSDKPGDFCWTRQRHVV